MVLHIYMEKVLWYPKDSDHSNWLKLLPSFEQLSKNTQKGRLHMKYFMSDHSSLEPDYLHSSYIEIIDTLSMKQVHLS